MIKVLFVCMGNICRSPTAEGIFTKLINDNNLQELVHIDSAGTHGYHEGHAPDSRSQAKANEKGIDISYLRARLVTISDFEEFDYVIAMDSSNYENLISLSPKKYHHKVKLLLELVEGLTTKDVPDPYYGGKDGFNHVFELVEKGCLQLLEIIKKDIK